MDGILGVLGVMVFKILRKKQQIYSEYYKATRKKIKIGDSLFLCAFMVASLKNE